MTLETNHPHLSRLRNHDSIVKIVGTDRCKEKGYVTNGGLYEFVCFRENGDVILTCPVRCGYIRMKPEHVKYVATLADAFTEIGPVHLDVGYRPSESKYAEAIVKAEAKARHFLNKRASDKKKSK